MKSDDIQYCYELSILPIIGIFQVTDLRGRLLVDPYWSTVTNGVTVAEEDMQVSQKLQIKLYIINVSRELCQFESRIQIPIQGLETYFWQAPDAYVGNKLVSYGQNIRIKTSWHTGRGDTAGISTKGPDIVLEVSKIYILAQNE